MRALLLSLALAAPCRAASPYAKAAQVKLGAAAITIGADASKSAAHLECGESKVQKTIRRCKLAEASRPFAAFLGRSVEAVTATLHWQGEAVNMSIELGKDSDVDAVLAQLEGLLGKKPGVQYWADDAHLFASYIWVDGETEVELTKTVKGDKGDGKVRLYVASIVGGRPAHPDDL
jgi:hypothetical protein